MNIVSVVTGRMGSSRILPVKVPIAIETMLKFDGSGKCKQKCVDTTVNCHLSLKVRLHVTSPSKFYHRANGD